MGGKLYKALGVLLTYPEQDLLDAVGAIEAICAEARLSAETRTALDGLLEQLRSWELLDLQERYVSLFDRGRQMSLNLFEHVHGDARERGQAMVDLQTMYQQNGVLPTDDQLPDYLPMLCEFLSILPPEGARAMLGDLVVILSLLRARLEQRESPYAGVLAALVELAEAEVDEAQVQQVLKEDPPERPDDFEAIDREWKEAEITFGAGDAQDACGSGAGGAGNGGDLVELRRTKH